MRKILVMAAVAMMTAMNVNAQNGYDETKHEVAISYGLWSNSEIIDAFENVGGILVGARFDNEKYFGPISAEYFYHTKNWLGVGGIFAYGQYEQDVYLAKQKDGVRKNTYLTLMPAVKLDWLRKKHFGMYSKLAFGSPTFRGFLELGTGEQGIALVGLRYKF